MTELNSTETNVGRFVSSGWASGRKGAGGRREEAWSTGCVQRTESLLSLLMFFSVIRPSGLANWRLVRVSSYPPVELGEGVPFSWVMTFQRGGAQVPKKGIPGW